MIGLISPLQKLCKVAILESLLGLQFLEKSEDLSNCKSLDGLTRQVCRYFTTDKDQFCKPISHWEFPAPAKEPTPFIYAPPSYSSRIKSRPLLGCNREQTRARG